LDHGHTNDFATSYAVAASSWLLPFAKPAGIPQRKIQLWIFNSNVSYATRMGFPLFEKCILVLAREIKEKRNNSKDCTIGRVK
jgi:hypothetical protein